MDDKVYKATRFISYKLHPPGKMKMICKYIERIEKFCDRNGIAIDTSSDIDCTGN